VNMTNITTSFSWPVGPAGLRGRATQAGRG
jgi:hypothetical protein